MIEYEQITVSLPIAVLQQLERMAERRQLSISGLAAEALQELVAQEREAYARAHEEFLATMDNPPNLGTNGQITWSRESLHER